MSDLLGFYQLSSPERGELVSVELYQGIEEQQIQLMPVLQKRQDRAILKVKAKTIADDNERRNAFCYAQAENGLNDRSCFAGS